MNPYPTPVPEELQAAVAEWEQAKFEENIVASFFLCTIKIAGKTFTGKLGVWDNDTAIEGGVEIPFSHSGETSTAAQAAFAKIVSNNQAQLDYDTSNYETVAARLGLVFAKKYSSSDFYIACTSFSGLTSKSGVIDTLILAGRTSSFDRFYGSLSYKALICAQKIQTVMGQSGVMLDIKPLKPNFR